MKDEATPNFGLIIAYLIPGAIALYGVSYFLPIVRSWFGTTPADAPTLGGFLYLTIAAIAAGMTVSTVRWGIVDTMHHWTGIEPPRLDFTRLSANVSGYDYLIEIHYRYYQFYANCIVALAFAYVLRRAALGRGMLTWDIWDGSFLVLELIFWAGSRDTLRKYYRRAEQLLAPMHVAPALESGDQP